MTKKSSTLTEVVGFGIGQMDYLRARVLLGQLMCEIRVRTFHLPLATYPDALFPVGAPFPRPGKEPGYYGVPLLKRPQWTKEIPVYFF